MVYVQVISIPKLETKNIKNKRKYRIKFSSNKSVKKIVTPLYTHLNFLETKKGKPTRQLCLCLKQAKSASSSFSTAMAHHSHLSPPHSMVASSNQTIFLYLSISLLSLDQTPKVSTSLYTRFSPNPNHCSF